MAPVKTLVSIFFAMVVQCTCTLSEGLPHPEELLQRARALNACVGPCTACESNCEPGNCDASKTCQQCASGYYSDPVVANPCQVCLACSATVANCATCFATRPAETRTTTVTCLTCSTGYAIDTQSNTCVPVATTSSTSTSTSTITNTTTLPCDATEPCEDDGTDDADKVSRLYSEEPAAEHVFGAPAVATCAAGLTMMVAGVVVGAYRRLSRPVLTSDASDEPILS